MHDPIGQTEQERNVGCARARVWSVSVLVMQDDLSCLGVSAQCCFIDENTTYTFFLFISSTYLIFVIVILIHHRLSIDLEDIVMKVTIQSNSFNKFLSTLLMFEMKSRANALLNC